MFETGPDILELVTTRTRISPSVLLMRFLGCVALDVASKLLLHENRLIDENPVGHKAASSLPSQATKGNGSRNLS